LRTSTLLCMAGLMLLGRGVAAQDVNYDYDQRANFSAYRTYAWAGGTNLADDLNHARIVAAVDRQLAAKGLVRVDSTRNPDVLVIYGVGLTQELEVNGYDRLLMAAAPRPRAPGRGWFVLVESYPASIPASRARARMTRQSESRSWSLRMAPSSLIPPTSWARKESSRPSRGSSHLPW
jgi:hypothetical protein